MADDDVQQFSLRWHKHQNSVIGALGRMLNMGVLCDVTLSASGTSIKAHRLILASCSQYFAQLFKCLPVSVSTTEDLANFVILSGFYFNMRARVIPLSGAEACVLVLTEQTRLYHLHHTNEMEADNNTLVVMLGCEAAELRLLLTFMYTGEVTASKKILPSLLRLAQTLKVSGLTDADTNPTPNPTDLETPQDEAQSSSPINLENKHENEKPFSTDSNSSWRHEEALPTDTKDPCTTDFLARNENDRLSKLDQIVQNLYSTHKIGNPNTTGSMPPLPSLLDPEPYDRKFRINSSVCMICNKRLSNQYNLRVHMETHAGRRHACRACSHVSRSRDALRKHVAYRHARTDVQRTDL